MSQSEYDAKAREVTALRAEVEQLKKTIDELRHGPERQLDGAVAAAANGNYQQAQAMAQALITKYPTSPQADKARVIQADAERAIKKAALEAQRAREQAMAGMVKKRDEMRNLTVWRDRAMPAFVHTRSWVGAYVMAPDTGQPYLRFAVYYTADDWLFIQRYLFKVDGRDLVFAPDQFGANAIERDNGSGGIWEWWDVPAEGQALGLLRALADSKAATLRYEGKQYHRDRTIGAEERAAIRRTLMAFDILAKSSS